MATIPTTRALMSTTGFPRKAHEALPARVDLVAWGLYFVDEVSWTKWAATVCVVMFLVLTFGIRTAVSYALDAAIGVSVSGNIVMVAQLVAGIMTVAVWTVPEYCISWKSKVCHSDQRSIG